MNPMPRKTFLRFTRRAFAWLGVTALLAGGCSRDSDAPPPPRATSFSFENAEETVTADRIRGDDSAKPIVADFNLDGLDDLAVMEGDGDNQNEIVIYIRKRGESEEHPVYYRGGSIQRHVDGHIIGVGHNRRGKQTDLLVLVARTNGPNDMVHYFNTGRGFSESLIGVDVEALPEGPDAPPES